MTRGWGTTLVAAGSVLTLSIGASVGWAVRPQERSTSTAVVPRSEQQLTAAIDALTVAAAQRPVADPNSAAIRAQLAALRQQLTSGPAAVPSAHRPQAWCGTHGRRELECRTLTLAVLRRRRRGHCAITGRIAAATTCAHPTWPAGGGGRRDGHVRHRVGHRVGQGPCRQIELPLLIWGVRGHR
jgi:hypothetical protein